MLQKVEHPSTLHKKILGMLQHETTTIFARQVAREGGKTGNTALQKCCAESCMNLMPVLPNLNAQTSAYYIHLHMSLLQQISSHQK